MANHCRAGVREWTKAYGIDMADIAGPNAPGIDTKELRAIGNRVFDEIADIAEAEEDGR